MELTFEECRVGSRDAASTAERELRKTPLKTNLMPLNLSFLSLTMTFNQVWSQTIRDNITTTTRECLRNENY